MKKCPFCGSDDVGIRAVGVDYIYCNSCGARGPHCIPVYDYYQLNNQLIQPL